MSNVRVHCGNNRHQAGSRRSNVVAVVGTLAPVARRDQVELILASSGVIKDDAVDGWVTWLIENGYLEIING